MVVHILVEGSGDADDLNCFRLRPSQAGRSCSLCLALAMMARLRTDGMMGFLLLAWHLTKIPGWLWPWNLKAEAFATHRDSGITR